MEYQDIFELLEAVRTYELRPKESIIPFLSLTGDVVGYATADGGYVSEAWTIGIREAKQSALDRGTKEARHVRELLSSHMGRKQLLQELRTGTLEYGVPRSLRGMEIAKATAKAKLPDLDDALQAVRDRTFEPEVVQKAEPYQHLIPGL